MNINFESLGLSKVRDVFLYESCATKSFVDELERYKDLYLPEPQKNWDLDEYKKRVYERTAVEEIEFLLRLNPDLDILGVIQEFRKDLEPSYNDFYTPDKVFEIISVFMETMDAIEEWIDY